MKKRNHLAKELWTPQYKPKVIPDKTKKIARKTKHKKELNNDEKHV